MKSSLVCEYFYETQYICQYVFEFLQLLSQNINLTEDRVEIQSDQDLLPAATGVL